EGEPALRHARLVCVDPGHLLARSLRRDRGGEQRASPDLRRGRPPRVGRRLLRVGWLGREPVRARGRARDGQAAPPQPHPRAPAGRRLRVAVGSEAHSSIVNTLKLLELDPLVIPTPDHRLTRESLAAAIEAEADQTSIAAVVCTSGTTNAGIVDDLAGVGAYA